VTDVMVEDPAGDRTLHAPTPELAGFLTAAYRHAIGLEAGLSAPRIPNDSRG
jgi:hypothetical protein